MIGITKGRTPRKSLGSVAEGHEERVRLAQTIASRVREGERLFVVDSPELMALFRKGHADDRHLMRQRLQSRIQRYARLRSVRMVEIIWIPGADCPTGLEIRVNDPKFIS